MVDTQLPPSDQDPAEAAARLKEVREILFGDATRETGERLERLAQELVSTRRQLEERLEMELSREREARAELAGELERLRGSAVDRAELAAQLRGLATQIEDEDKTAS